MADMPQQMNSNRPFIYFGAYCFGGVSLLSYVAYRGFSKAAHKIKIDRPIGQRLQLSKMASVGGVWKAGLAMGLYLAGFTYLAYNLNLGDIVFQSCIRKDQDYINKIKLDPFFQDFYIINIMQYFGISDQLIKKTEEELRSKIKANEGQEVKQGGLVNLEKNVLQLAYYFGGQPSPGK